ncbi:MAG: bifunctional folylpolyglutamate synthase/dihydrofolate synthase [Flavobacteriales bacterium]|nr:bifunctional folylpolyglutamate synthase/dihydrofolate synthase [Flavobacteriales bacterium]
MNYSQVLRWIYNALPMFQNIGQGAYKEGLDGTRMLMAHVGNPEKGLCCIHVAGTNGKGSVSNMLASVLKEAGYKVGLYTSPHLLDFRERIRVDGQMIPEENVTCFVNENFQFFSENHFSFFEMSTAMAFDYFKQQKVDIAVVEVGLGGRLDCTNVITPLLSIITNIALDHVALLGNTRAEIASEKAGIIKKGIPALVGEADDEILPVFQRRAREVGTELYTVCQGDEYKKYECPLCGQYQRFNISTVLSACKLLEKDLSITEESIKKGLANVVKNMEFHGRWQILRSEPTVICDTGHNVNGINEVSSQLQNLHCKNLRMVFGMVADKDIDGVLTLLPTKAVYYFSQATVHRAMPSSELKSLAEKHGLLGQAYLSVKDALTAAMKDADAQDVVFIGGSTFTVADAMSCGVVE